MTSMSSWFLLYPASNSKTTTTTTVADVGTFVWMTLAGVLGLRICANAVWFYNFCIDWNSVTQKEWADLAALHFFQSNFVSRKRQIEHALITTTFGAAKKQDNKRNSDGESTKSVRNDKKTCTRDHAIQVSSLTRPQDDQSTTSCPICLCDYRDNEKVCRSKNFDRCGHTFHAACLQLWLSNHSSCPVCRYEIMPPVSSVAPSPPLSRHPGTIPSQS